MKTINIENIRNFCDKYLLFFVGSNAKVRTKNFFKENVKQINFKDEAFDHINCQVVIHQSPNMKNSLIKFPFFLKKIITYPFLFFIIVNIKKEI